MRLRSLLIAGLTGVALLVPTSVVHAAPYPPTVTVTVEVSPSRIKQGQCTTVTGKGFLPNVTVTIDDGGQPIGQATTDRSGTFRQRICFPSNARIGQHDIGATGMTATGPRRASATLTITGVEKTRGGKSNVSNETTLNAGTTKIATGLGLAALVAFAALQLLLSERRHRARRRSRA